MPILTGLLRPGARSGGPGAGVPGRRAAGAPRRSASHSRCSMCQSSGWSAMPEAKASASACVMAAVFSARVPRRGHLDRRVDPAPHDGRVVVPEGDRQQQRRRSAGRAARARRASGSASPKNSHLDAGGGQVAVGDQADQAAAAQPPGERAEGGAAGVRQHLHAEALAVGDEAVVQRLGLEALGDGGEGRPQLGGDPGAGEVLVGHVRQGEDDARGRRRARRSGGARPRRRSRRGCGPRSRRAAGRTPSSSAGRSACPARDSSASRSGVASGHARGRGCASSRSTPLPRRFQATSATVRPRRTRDRLGELLDRAPAAGRTAPSVSRSFASRVTRRPRCAAAAAAAASASADSRRTVTTRWTRVTRLPTATIHSAIGSSTWMPGTPNVVQAGEAGSDQRDHQPLGALDEAVDGDRQADRLAAGLGVRHHLAAGQAEDRHRAQHEVVAAARVPEREAAEDRASATRSRVESRKAPQRLERPSCRAMLPSTRSEKTNSVMTIVPQKNSPRG